MAVQRKPELFTSTLDPKFESESADEAVAHDTAVGCMDAVSDYVNESGRFTKPTYAEAEKKRLFEFLKHMLLIGRVHPPAGKSENPGQYVSG